MTRWSRWNIAVGNFFFKYRNGLFPVLFVLAALLGRPQVLFGDPALERALGLCGVLVAGSPLMVGLVLPFFLFVYQAIVAAEEAYLRGRFGERYAQYCAAVPRWWPDLRRAGAAFSGQRYQWRRAIRKDLSTLLGLFTGLIFLPVWRIYGVGGWEAAKASAARAVLWETGVFAVYGVLYVCKKRRKFLYAAEEFEQHSGGR